MKKAEKAELSWFASFFLALPLITQPLDRAVETRASKLTNDSSREAQSAPARGNPSPWWESEPLLIFEVCMWTTPGRAVGSNWQASTDPAEEVDIVKDSGARQTHLLSVVEGHLTNQFCYFQSKDFKEVRRDYLGEYLRKSKPAGYRLHVLLPYCDEFETVVLKD